MTIMGLRLGKVINVTEYVEVSEDSDNQSLLIVGRSGSGKTFALKNIEKRIAHSEGAVLVLNYHGTHSELSGSEDVYWIDALKEGIPLSLLSPVVGPDGTQEDKLSIIESALDVFCNVSTVKVRQRKALREAIKSAWKRDDVKDNEVWAIGDELREANNEIADAVYERFYDVFTRGKVSAGKPLFEKGKITVLDLNGYTEQAQSVFAEMALAILWRYFRIWGQHAKNTLYIVADEFQVLCLNKNSIFAKLLREGRKYHIALILATQTLADLKKENRVILQQAATQLYFHPSASEARDISKILDLDGKMDFKQMLLSLQRGEYLAIGRLKIGSAIIKRPIKMKF